MAATNANGGCGGRGDVHDTTGCKADKASHWPEGQRAGLYRHVVVHCTCRLGPGTRHSIPRRFLTPLPPLPLAAGPAASPQPGWRLPAHHAPSSSLLTFHRTLRFYYHFLPFHGWRWCAGVVVWSEESDHHVQWRHVPMAAASWRLLSCVAESEPPGIPRNGFKMSYNLKMEGVLHNYCLREPFLKMVSRRCYINLGSTQDF